MSDNDDFEYQEVDPEDLPPALRALLGAQSPEEQARQEIQAESDLAELNEFIFELDPRQKLLLSGLLSVDETLRTWFLGRISALMQYVDQVDPKTGKPYTEGLE